LRVVVDVVAEEEDVDVVVVVAEEVGAVAAEAAGVADIRP
jgi:hypothetical protein